MSGASSEEPFRVALHGILQAPAARLPESLDHALPELFRALVSVGLGDLGVVLGQVVLAVAFAPLALAVAESILRHLQLLLRLALPLQPLLRVALLQRIRSLARRLLGGLEGLERRRRERLLI